MSVPSSWASRNNTGLWVGGKCTGTEIRERANEEVGLGKKEWFGLGVNRLVNPYPTAFPYGNDMVLHFCQQQESSTTKTVHKVINKGLKTYV